jgi:hypothetical protein
MSAPNDGPERTTTLESQQEESEIDRLARERDLARGYHEAARRALGYARLYRQEEGPGGARERACVTQAGVWRQTARDLRAAGALSGSSGPGVRSTRGAARVDDRKVG